MFFRYTNQCSDSLDDIYRVLQLVVTLVLVLKRLCHGYFYVLGSKFGLNQNYEHFLLHKMVLELQEEDIK